MENVEKFMSGYKLPIGYSWNFGSGLDFEKETKKTMVMNIIIALFLIYFVMAALFESYLFPAAIWSSIIFAIIGVYWFFFLTGTTLSLLAWIGILVLIGVVVNNGIVLIDHITQLRSENISRYEAILRAGKERFRPIFMTAATTVLSMLPLCVTQARIAGDGPSYFPLARAIVGGLTFSTIITLLILPTIYVLIDDFGNYFKNIFWKSIK